MSLVTMKIRFKMENKSHKYDINRLALGMDTYIKYKMYLSTMKVIYICILSNT